MALGILLSPFLVAGVLAALLLFIQREPKAAQQAAASPAARTDWLRADAASYEDASVEVTQGIQEMPGKGATTVTTYTIIPTY